MYMKNREIGVLIVQYGSHPTHVLRERLRREHFQVRETPNLTEAFDLMRHQWPHVVVLEVDQAQDNGIEMLRKIHTQCTGLEVILATHSPNFQDAIEVGQLGVNFYFETPSNNEEIVDAIRNAYTENQRLPAGNFLPPEEVGEWNLLSLMGWSRQIHDVATEVARVAPTNFSVVILGETGAGKELVARAIHAQSLRSGKRFLSLDCGAIPEPLIENELFGHERGAYTGADRVIPGKFEASSGGTLLLDEVANLPHGMQSRLLRVLEEKQVFRIGSTDGIQLDLRVLAASNQDLSSLISLHAFREDLFHRLSEYIIQLPALRERREDILFLAERILRDTNRELARHVEGFSASAIGLLQNYNWPGNVRELRNVIRGAVLLSDELIEPDAFRFRIPRIPVVSMSRQLSNEKQPTLKQIVRQSTEQVERAILEQTLVRTGGNKAEAARLLGIDYKTIHAKIRKYGVQGKKIDSNTSDARKGQKHTDVSELVPVKS